MNFLKGVYNLKGGKYVYIFYGRDGKHWGVISDSPKMSLEEWDEFGNHPDSSLHIQSFRRTEENYCRATDSFGSEAQNRDSFSSRVQFSDDKSKEV
jgi:hypothetical protein